MDQLTSLPLTFVAGDYLNLKESYSDYPASENWAITYTLVNASAIIEITSTASDDDHLMQVAIATTADWESGVYDWQKRVSNGTVTYTLDIGQITIKPSFTAQSTSYDNRSHVKKTLDALESVILGKASKDQLSYSIAGRSISRMSPNELLEWRDKYKAEYRAELVRDGKTPSRRVIKTKFVRIS